MGLGPPVCDKCKQIYNYRLEAPRWVCPTCGETDSDVSLFQLSSDEKVAYELNKEKRIRNESS